MKALAYVCSYKENEEDFLLDIKLQKDVIEKFAKQEEIEVLDFYYEKQNSRDDFKPVLLNIIDSYYGKIDKILVVNNDVISRNENFRDWVKDELARIGAELILASGSRSSAFVKALNIKKKVKNIPSLPEVVEKVIQLVQDEKSSTEDLGKVISTDVGLTSKVLKLVNSSYYGFSKQIGSVSKAISVLGFTTIRGLVLSSGISKMFAQKPSDKEGVFDYQAYWRHNLLTAIGAKYLYDLMFEDDKDEIFSAAMLHDFGKIILAQYDTINYQKAYPLVNKSFDFEKNLELEKLYCGVSHCEIAHLVASDWDLPDEILDVNLYHHSPKNSEKFKLSCIIVNIADIITNLLQANRELDFEYFDKDLIKEFKISEENICLTYNKIALEHQKMKTIEDIFD